VHRAVLAGQAATILAADFFHGALRQNPPAGRIHPPAFGTDTGV
jgi:hypothetical protein